MSHAARTWIRAQRIDIFSKPNPVRVRVRLSLMAALLFAVFTGLFAVWERVQYLRLGHEIQLLRQEHEALVREGRSLRAEYERSVTLETVEERARRDLGLVIPSADQLIYMK